MKMGVILEVGALARSFALEVDLLDQPAADQSVEAVVDRGEGDRGHLGFDAGEDFLRGRVVTLLQERTIDQLTLRRGAEPAVGEPL